ncbi:MAG: aminotransferase class I/II-fold pyridoxal phosphate-dependent enzyme [Lachnospiraceae bacterium]|nr:aminotransferase class I/II-fold pyridoxal phosphate-dependent enzyme [Lachnospiraceae bacterium]
MKKYESLSKPELETLLNELEASYKTAQKKGLKLDMSRGKPAPEQLDLSNGLLNINIDDSYISKDGLDCRNYGGLTGIPEAKLLFAELFCVPVENTIINGNSSLNVMYDMISRGVTHGVMGSTPWCRLEKVKFLCPAPGYDRHFKITEHFGIEMITIPMTETGPDMDAVEKYVNGDKEVKGIWCVPKYSNPQGISYSDETVRRFANLRPAAKDFRIYWDNAYIVHHFDDNNQDEILDLFNECNKAGNPDLALMFSSFSKISFSGAGISATSASKANLDFIQNSMQIQTIGPDKLNMLRHVHFFKNLDGIKAHMQKHAAIIKPKFEIVLTKLAEEIGGLGIGEWLNPKGGYFVSFAAMPGTAKTIISLCKEAGVTMTEAGATYPYGIDPNDSNIRIAPSFPTVAELNQAMDLFILCVKLAGVRKLLQG